MSFFLIDFFLPDFALDIFFLVFFYPNRVCSFGTITQGSLSNEILSQWNSILVGNV